MRRKIVALAFLCYVLALSGCSAQNNHHTQLSDYGLWGETTKILLDNNFTNSLPDNEVVKDYGHEYYYKSSQSVMGDESFVIYVVLTFPDEVSYWEELSKYTILQSNPISQNDNTYYPIQYSHEAVTEYTDGKYYDGMFYNFEVISTNTNEYTISFINAHVWDYYNDQVLIDFLQPIVNDFVRKPLATKKQFAAI